MISLVVFSVGAAIVAGLIIKFALKVSASDLQITWLELLIGIVIISVIVAPVTANVGWKLAKNSKLSFNEYWNGWEMGTEWIVTPCTRDGPCIHEYDCDSYSCNPHSCNCDSEGKNCSTCWDTCYHDCPYCTEEWTFKVNTTLGDFTIAGHIFPDNPIGWRKPIPSNIINRVGTGTPPFWLEAKMRVDAGTPGPVTKRMTYDNYILASEKTILQQYSDMVQSYLDQGLLPYLQYETHSWYYSNKVSFVGYSPSNPDVWQKTLMYLNGALGTELQGDLHLVIVQDDTISANPDAYILALKAYWQNPDVWEDNAISKNSIIVAIGTRDGQTVDWGRTITGMPLGNEHMLVAIRNNLKGLPLTPESVLGIIQGEFYIKTYDDGSTKTKVRGINDEGALRRTIWGMDEPQTQFSRISMSGDDADDIGGGFLYLDSEIEPSTGQKVAIVVVTFILCCLVWVLFANYGETRRRKSHYGY